MNQPPETEAQEETARVLEETQEVEAPTAGTPAPEAQNPDNQEPEKPETEEPETPAPQAAVSEAKPKPRKKSRVGIVFFAVVLLFPVLMVLSLKLPLPVTEDKTIIIARGASVQAIASTLQDNGIPLNAYVFRLAARLFANDSLKAGEYRLTKGQNVIDVVNMMFEGKSVPRMLTIPEGLTVHEILALLRNDPALSGEISALPAEGSLLPETYRYTYGDSRSELIGRMKKSHDEQTGALWQARQMDLPLKSVQEAIILASIVEKETGKKAEERVRVAGVFLNRLKQGMRLQSDPTVIYALTNGQKPLGRDLRKEDLAVVSPYNTYVNVGLPPSPISNPGRASLEAVLHPEKNDFLYFVADGTGGHAFAKDLLTHNKNVARWIGLQPKNSSNAKPASAKQQAPATKPKAAQKTSKKRS